MQILRLRNLYNSITIKYHINVILENGCYNKYVNVENAVFVIIKIY